MKKFIIVFVVAILALSISGCGVVDKVDANLTGYTVHCVAGVEYIQFPRGASVAYNPDGTIKICG